MMRPARRLCIVVLLFAALGAAGALLWKRRQVEPMPPPPDLVLDGLDADLREAIQTARAKVTAQPRSAEAWGHLGKLLRTPNFNEEASFCFAQAEKLEPNEVRWPYLRGEAILLETPEKALPHLRRAVEIADQREPDNLVPRLRLAEVLLAAGQHDDADTCLRQAREIEPDNINVIYGLGLLAAIRGEFEESRRLLLRCQHSEFTRQKASQQLAAVCERLGKTDEAAKFHQKSRELPKDDNWPDRYIMDYRQLAKGKQIRFQYAERLAAQGKFQDAVLKLQEILDDGPDFRAYVGLGTYLGRLGDIDGAERALHEAIKLQPDSTKAYYYLARLHLTRGQHYQGSGKDQAKAEEQFRAAADAAQQALSHKPDDALSYMTLGLALKHRGRQAEALNTLRIAVECGPELIDPHYYLGEALAEAGQPEEARKHLEQVVQLAKPDDPLRKLAQERLRNPKSEIPNPR